MQRQAKLLAQLRQLKGEYHEIEALQTILKLITCNSLVNRVSFMEVNDQWSIMLGSKLTLCSSEQASGLLYLIWTTNL